MIETTVPEINITELMERVRAEALRPKPPLQRPPPAGETATSLPPVTMLPSAPAVWIPGPVKSRKERLDTLVQTAREKNEPRSSIPKFLRRFFRKQGGYNRAVVESVAALSKTTEDLTRRMGEITACLGQLNGWLLSLHEQSDADANWMKAAAPEVARVTGHESELRQVRNELVSAQATLSILSADQARSEETGRRVAALEEQRTAFAERLQTAESQFSNQFAAIRQADEASALASNLRGRVDLLGSELERVRKESETFQTESRALGENLTQANREVGERQSQLRSELEDACEHLRNLQTQTDRLSQHVTNLQNQVDRQSDESASLRQSFDQRVGEIANDAVFLKGELSEYGLLLRQLLGKESQPTVSPHKPPRRGGPVGLVSFYFDFENRFRGSRKEIKTRVAFYLPFIRKARAGSARRPILDLGCGRGEWLELLKEE